MAGWVRGQNGTLSSSSRKGLKGWERRLSYAIWQSHGWEWLLSLPESLQYRCSVLWDFCGQLESKGENAGVANWAEILLHRGFCPSEDNILRLNTVAMLKNAHFPQDFRLQNINLWCSKSLLPLNSKNPRAKVGHENHQYKHWLPQTARINCSAM